MRPLKCAIALLCLGSFAIQASASDDVETALSTLERAKEGITRAELEECVSILRAQSQPGDSAILQRLMSAIRDTKTHRDVRKAAMQLSCEKANDRIAQQILSLVTSWKDCADDSGLPVEGRVGEREIVARTILTDVVVQEGLPYIEQALSDQEPLLHLLALQQASGAIVRNPAPIERRRFYALQVISRRKHRNSPARDLFPLIDSSCYAGLRELVAASDDPLDFHYHAAVTLAYLGDQELAPILESKRERFRSVQPRFERTLLYYIWLVRVQNPPSKLLEYIRSDEDKDDPVQFLRVLAMQRALERGFSKAKVREAVLKHAEEVDRTEVDEQHPLVRLKEKALDLGVLQEGDLPYVPKRVRLPESQQSRSEFPTVPDASSKE